MNTPNMDDVSLAKFKKIAEAYYDRFRDQMDLLEKSTLAKVKPIDSYDVYSLGKQLESFDFYKKICEDQGNVNLLGKIPDVAFDVITAVYGASIIPVLASVQPIEEERGTVYFKQIRSATTKGTATDGQVVMDPRTGVVTNTGFSSNIFESVLVVTTVSATTSYSFTLSGGPIKLESLSLTMGANVLGKDVGPAPGGPTYIGRIFGIGMSGTVNYRTGDVTLLLAADPGAGQQILATYQQNYELSQDIPQIDTFFDSKGILARVYALKSTMGMLQAYGMSKRFGLVHEDELAKDLVQEINREIGGDLIRKIRSGSVGSTTFSKTPPSGVSYFEHKQTYKDTLATAESNIVANAGRGTISVLLAGKSQAAIIQALPGFQKISDGTTLGSHVFGTLDGMTVVRVVEDNILGTNQGVGLWKGSSPWEAAAVYSPYMPLTVTATLPQAPNPLTSMKAAAVWAGVDSLVPQFATNIDVTP